MTIELSKIGRLLGRRWFDRSTAAEYLEVSLSFFDAEIKPHLTPSLLGSRARYDREEIDKFMEARRVEL